MFLYYGSGQDAIADSLQQILLYQLSPSESLVNQAGYRMLGRRDCEKALEFFRSNVERFPNSSNVWDSQGDGFMACEEYTKAAASYEEAVRLGELQKIGNLEVYRDNLEAAKAELSRLEIKQ